MNVIKKTILMIMYFTTIQTAFANAISNNYQISATVEPRCILSVPNINFGTIRLINNNYQHSVNEKILIRCVKNTAYRISIDKNSSSLEHYELKHINGEDKIFYNILTPQKTLWGNGLNGTNIFSDISNGGNESIAIEFIIAPQQSATPGFYIDNIFLTIDY